MIVVANALKVAGSLPVGSTNIRRSQFSSLGTLRRCRGVEKIGVLQAREIQP